MKSSAAFAVGLWAGAIAAVVAAVVYVRMNPGHATDSGIFASSDAKEVFRLRQENARLSAENERLTQTIGELSQRKDSVALTEPAPPVRELPAATPASADQTDGPPDIADTVASLEAAALQNDIEALDRLAQLANHGGTESLARVWNSTTLNAANRIRTAYYLGATAEAYPQADKLLRDILLNSGSDDNLVTAVLQGITRPDLPGEQPEQESKFDFPWRLQLLDQLRTVAGTGSLRQRIETARRDLADRLAASGVAAR